ncbi:alpha/beta hydrolase family protein [Hyalangium rubrum]|uniref:Chlorophyllase n=1 Tax=Hyalangium rubrum TaxID=3103134 RepID=A0ABU5HE36_9BACT|nr:chlorophyllase [Hyalangium sp. s54d21]MDY7231722.1 chlorophyllase [Hyalangium sp. s54d21]
MHPLTLLAPGRGVDLQVRVSAPVNGGDLPIIVFSHGFGSSMDGYAPLVDYWSARGFVVIQPTHLDSRRLGLAEGDPRRPVIWRFRVDDVKRVLDNLERLEAAAPELAGRVARSRIAIAGHSFGAQTASMLLGARMVASGGDEDMRDPRISAGVLLAAGGRGGDDLSPFAKEHLPYLDSSFEHMATPTLVVAGDHDRSPLTVRGPDWFTDPYTLSPGGKALLTLFGGEHMLGGISGYEVTETTDENPERVALVQRMSWAFLRSALYPEDAAWREACASLPDAQGRIDCK